MVLFAYPDPYNMEQMQKALHEGTGVLPKEGSVAYRAIRLKPKIQTEKVTFHTGFGWLSEKEWLVIECKQSPTGKHEWKTQTPHDEDRTQRHDWGLIIGTFCVHCYQHKKEK